MGMQRIKKTGKTYSSKFQSAHLKKLGTKTNTIQKYKAGKINVKKPR